MLKLLVKLFKKSQPVSIEDIMATMQDDKIADFYFCPFTNTKEVYMNGTKTKAVFEAYLEKKTVTLI